MFSPVMCVIASYNKHDGKWKNDSHIVFGWSIEVENNSPLNDKDTITLSMLTDVEAALFEFNENNVIH